jgi:hypothetical protein
MISSSQGRWWTDREIFRCKACQPMERLWVKFSCGEILQWAGESWGTPHPLASPFSLASIVEKFFILGTLKMKRLLKRLFLGDIFILVTSQSLTLMVASSWKIAAKVLASHRPLFRFLFSIFYRYHYLWRREYIFYWAREYPNDSSCDRRGINNFDFYLVLKYTVIVMGNKVAVVAMNEERWGEVPCAFVTLKEAFCPASDLSIEKSKHIQFQ